MRILHVAKYYHPYKGGMESIIKDLCEGLVELGHEVTVLCSHDKWKHEEEVICGVRVVRLPRIGVIFGQNINLTAITHLKKLAASSDIVHIHGPNPLFEMAALVLPKSKALVCTHHSDIIRQKLLLCLYRPFHKLFLKRLKHIYVPTFNHIKYSHSILEYEDKCHIVPFGIHTNHLSATDETLKLVQKIRYNYSPYVLFIGRLVSYKGLPVLIKAMRKMEQHLVIIGDGPEYNVIKDLIKKYKLHDRVHLEGKVSQREEFSAFLHGCEFLVLPSISSNENFGIVQLEAMFCSKPVVTTDLKSGVPAVGIDKVTTLLTEPGNSEDLRLKMAQLFNDKDLCKEMGQAARKRFDEFYTCETMVKIQENNYKNLNGF